MKPPKPNRPKFEHWNVPQDFYDRVNAKYNFDYQPCPYSEDNLSIDGLFCEWGQSNFLNPPTSRELKEKFIVKAITESKKGKLCVVLLPVYTSSKFFHEVVIENNPEIWFVRGRLKFEGKNWNGQPIKNQAGMTDSMLVVFDGRDKKH